MPRDRVVETIVSASSLGLLWAWYMYAGCGVAARTFGLELDDAVALQTLSLACVSLNLIATRLWKSKGLPARAYAVAGSVFAAAATFAALVCISAGSYPTIMQALVSMLSGLAYSSILIAWIALHLNRDLKSLLPSVFLAIGIIGAGYLVLALLGGLAPLASLLYPLGSSVLLSRRNPLEKATGSVARPDSRPERQRAQFLLYSLSLVLCGGFSRGILASSWSPSLSLDWAGVLVALSAIAFAAVFLLPGKITGNSVLASLAGAVCVAVVGALFLPPGNIVLSSFIFTIGWLLLAFTIASAMDFFGKRASNPVGSACACIALVLFASALSNILTSQFSAYKTELLVLSTVLLILSLVITMAMQTGKHAVAFSAADGSGPSTDVADRCRVLADRHGLTEREYDVLLLLAKGNTLKGVAEKLLVSESTVKSHRSHVYQKLGIKSRQSLINMLESDED